VLRIDAVAYAEHGGIVAVVVSARKAGTSRIVVQRSKARTTIVVRSVGPFRA
jgi:hypothetical protein